MELITNYDDAPTKFGETRPRSPSPLLITDDRWRQNALHGRTSHPRSFRYPSYYTRGRHYLSYCLVSKIVGFWNSKISKIQNCDPRRKKSNFLPHFFSSEFVPKNWKWHSWEFNILTPWFFNSLNYTYFESPCCTAPLYQIWWNFVKGCRS